MDQDEFGLYFWQLYWQLVKLAERVLLMAGASDVPGQARCVVQDLFLHLSLKSRFARLDKRRNAKGFLRRCVIRRAGKLAKRNRLRQSEVDPETLVDKNTLQENAIVDLQDSFRALFPKAKLSPHEALSLLVWQFAKSRPQALDAVNSLFHYDTVSSRAKAKLRRAANPDFNSDSWSDSGSPETDLFKRELTKWYVNFHLIPTMQPAARSLRRGRTPQLEMDVVSRLLPTEIVAAIALSLDAGIAFEFLLE